MGPFTDDDYEAVMDAVDPAKLESYLPLHEARLKSSEIMTACLSTLLGRAANVQPPLGNAGADLFKVKLSVLVCGLNNIVKRHAFFQDFERMLLDFMCAFCRLKEPDTDWQVEMDTDQPRQATFVDVVQCMNEDQHAFCKVLRNSDLYKDLYARRL